MEGTCFFKKNFVDNYELKLAKVVDYVYIHPLTFTPPVLSHMFSYTHMYTHMYIFFTYTCICIGTSKLLTL